LNAAPFFRELPSSDAEAWYEAADGLYRWRQTASTVLLQLHVLPDDVYTSKQLRVSIEPYTLRVEERGSGELLFEADLARGILPGDSTWTLVQPDGTAVAAAASAVVGVGHDGGGSSRVGALGTYDKHHSIASIPAAAAVAASGPTAALLPASAATMATAAALVALPGGAGTISSSSSGGGSGRHILFELTKMNWELYQR
jgi:hypothetical protein